MLNLLIEVSFAWALHGVYIGEHYGTNFGSLFEGHLNNHVMTSQEMELQHPGDLQRQF